VHDNKKHRVKSTALLSAVLRTETWHCRLYSTCGATVLAARLLTSLKSLAMQTNSIIRSQDHFEDGTLVFKPEFRKKKITLHVSPKL
jgi:hypothetical protein